MSKRDKFLARFLSKPTDFSFSELRTLLEQIGYREFTAGATSGSRVVFIHAANKHVIRLHKPHPTEISKRYQLDEIEGCLRAKGRIK